MFTKNSKNDKVDCPYIKRIEVKPQNTDDNKKLKKSHEYKKKKSKPIEIEKDYSIPPDEDIQYTYVWKNLPNDILIIFDEAHRCKNPRTLNSVLLYTLAKTTTKILMLSATISDKPENFALCGFVLGLYNNIRNANNWMASVSKDYDNVCAGVHNQLYPDYAARIRTNSLGALFPSNKIIANSYDMDCAEEIQKNYKLIEDEVERLKNREENSGCALSRILFARMKIEMLKAPTYIELAKNFIEEGNAVAIFVNFTQTLKFIADELKTTCVIHGQQTLQERDKALNDFNSDKSQIIVCNVASGGVGISMQDQHGKYPRISIISPGYNASQIVQALGRIHRANGKTPVKQYIVFCADTIEEEICKNIKLKIDNIANLNDSDTLSYQIEGLTDDPYEVGIDKDANLSEFDKLFMRINTLNIKKQRLEFDLKEVNDEVESLEMIINNLI